MRIGIALGVFAASAIAALGVIALSDGNGVDVVAVDAAAEPAGVDPTRTTADAPQAPGSTTTSSSTSTTTTEPTIRFTDWFVASPPTETPDRLARTAATAQEALDAARPGDVVHLGVGSHGLLRIEGFEGTVDAPLTIRAEPGAVADQPGYGTGATVNVIASSHVIVEGLAVRRGTFGIVIDASEHVVLRGVDVADVGQEGIVISHASSNVEVVDSTISFTGRHVEGWLYGEGIYVGTGDPAARDEVSHVTIRDNEIFATTAEAIDIKHYATDVLIEGNVIHDVDTATTGAVVVGIGTEAYGDPRVTIRSNVVSNVTSSRQPYLASNCIVVSAPARVYNNVVHDCEHRGIWVDADVTGPSTDIVIAHNTVFRGGSVGDIVVDSGDVVVSSNIGSTIPGNIASAAELFVAPAAFDFRLAAIATKAIDRAPGLDGIVEDRAGESRPQGAGPDMGAYELIGEPAVAASVGS